MRAGARQGRLEPTQPDVTLSPRLRPERAPVSGDPAPPTAVHLRRGDGRRLSRLPRRSARRHARAAGVERRRAAVHRAGRPDDRALERRRRSAARAFLEDDNQWVLLALGTAAACASIAAILAELGAVKDLTGLDKALAYRADRSSRSSAPGPSSTCCSRCITPRNITRGRPAPKAARAPASAFPATTSRPMAISSTIRS